MVNDDKEYVRLCEFFVKEQIKKKRESKHRIKGVINALMRDDPEYYNQIDWNTLFNNTVTINNEIKLTRKK